MVCFKLLKASWRRRVALQLGFTAFLFCFAVGNAEEVVNLKDESPKYQRDIARNPEKPNSVRYGVNPALFADVLLMARPISGLGSSVLSNSEPSKQPAPMDLFVPEEDSALAISRHSLTLNANNVTIPLRLSLFSINPEAFVDIQALSSAVGVTLLKSEDIGSAVYSKPVSVKVGMNISDIYSSPVGVRVQSQNSMGSLVGQPVGVKKLTDEAGGSLFAAAVEVNVGGEEGSNGRTIQSDEVWTGSVQLTGDVYIPEGVTLTIAPGTLIALPSRYDDSFSGTNTSLSEIKVNGNLLVQGTQGDPVVFSTDQSLSSPGDWEGIVVDGGRLTIQHAQISNAVNAIYCLADGKATTCNIDQVQITDSYSSGIRTRALNGGSLTSTITWTSVTHSLGVGLYSYSTGLNTLSLVTVDNSHFDSNEAHGASLDIQSASESSFILRNSSFNENSQHGVYLRSDNRPETYFAFENNEVAGNSGGNGLYIDNRLANENTHYRIRGNHFSTNFSNGILFRSLSTVVVEPEILDNTVVGNGEVGLKLFHSSSGLLIPQIKRNSVVENNVGISLLASVDTVLERNELYGNFSYDLQNESSQPIIARQNWWGVDTTEQLNLGSHPRDLSVIYDSFDDIALGEVDYSLWLQAYVRPEAPVVNPLSEAVNAQLQVLTGTKPAGTAIEINGNIVAPADSLTSWTATLNLSESRNNLSVRSLSSSGLVSESVEVYVTVDTSPPLILSSDPASGSVTNQLLTQIKLTLFDADGDVDIDFARNSAELSESGVAVLGAWTDSGNELIFTPDQTLLPGIYSVTVGLRDEPFNNSVTGSITFSIDTTAPAALTLNPVTSPSNNSSQTLSGTKEPDTAVWLNGFEIVPINGEASWSFNYALLKGVNVFELVTVDLAGNISAPIHEEIVLDTGIPQVVSVTPEDDSYIAVEPASITLTIFEDNVGLDETVTLASASLINQSAGVVSGLWSVDEDEIIFVPDSSLEEGLHTVNLTLVDLAGNSLDFQSNFTFDISAPAVPNIVPVLTPTIIPTQLIQGTKDAGSGIYINGEQVILTNAATTWSYLLPLVAGTNIVEISAHDLAGNVSPVLVAEIYYDDIPPTAVTELTIDPQGRGDTVELDWSDYDESVHGDFAGYEIYVESSLFNQITDLTPVASLTAGTQQYGVTGLQEGQNYFFAVVAFDENGNKLESVNAQQAIPLDVVAPENPNSVVVNIFANRLLMQWDASENSWGDLTNYLLYLDGNGPISLDSSAGSYDFDNLEPATIYELRITSVDDNGNESSGITQSIATLLSNPTILGVLPLNNMVEISWSAVEPGNLLSHYAVYAETSPFTSVADLTPKLNVDASTTVKRLAGLINNTEYFFAITAVNVSGGEEREVVTVASTPVADEFGPELTDITFNNQALTNGTAISSSGVLAAQASDDSGMSRVEFRINNQLLGVDTYGGDGYSANLDLAGINDGSHIINVAAYDSLSNSSVQEFTIQVALAPPAPPLIQTPQTNYITNQQNVAISGTAEAGSQIFVYIDDAQVSGPTFVGNNGTFNTNVALPEGTNAIKVAASNRGGLGAFSNVVQVTRDTSLPDAPTNLSALSKEFGEIQLRWLPSLSDNVAGYDVYRSSSEFVSIAEAEKINSSLITSTGFTDLPANDGRYFYRLSAVNNLGTAGALSNMVSAVSDSILPVAESIVFTPQGEYDEATGRYGVGRVDVLVTVNEPLLTTPFLSLSVSGGTPINISLQASGELSYQGSFDISENTRSGVAYAIFSARDKIGNRGTEVTQGSSIVIDTQGPVVESLIVTPNDPIQNDVAQPVTVSLILNLDEALPEGNTPQLKFLLSKDGREETEIVDLAQDSAQVWSAQFVLPNDAGLEEVESLQFIYSAQDDLNNTGTTITDYQPIQIYQGGLPPLAVPTNFTAVAQPGGQIQLEWDAVSDAENYQVYRQAPDESELTEYLTLGGTSFIDSPLIEGIYLYSVASIRNANGQESLSAQSIVQSVESDSTAPDSPSGLIIDLQGSGVNLTWTHQPAPGDINTYAVYRSATEIIDTQGLLPLATGMTDSLYVDVAPSGLQPYYAVTALDEVGNQSPPSNSAYLNTDLLPVTQLKVVQEDESLPMISWSYNNPNVSDFKVYLDQGGELLPLTPKAITEQSFTDFGYVFRDERNYLITAMDANDVESLERAVTLPALQITPPAQLQVRRGLMNKFSFSVLNMGAQSVTNLVLEVELGGISHQSTPLSLSTGESKAVAVVVGGYDQLEASEALNVSAVVTSTTAEQAVIRRNLSANVSDGAFTIDLEAGDLPRGATGTARFVFYNTSDAEIDIVTAIGAQPSNEINLLLKDEDGNVLSSSALKQSIGNNILSLGNGKTVARIPAGGSFVSTDISIEVPHNVPDTVELELKVDKVHYKLGTVQSVTMDGLSVRSEVELSDVPYSCQVDSVAPASVLLIPGEQASVAIGGRALDNESLTPLAAVPLVLVLDNRGFERTFNVFTDDDGNFNFDYEPQVGEYGIYSVNCIHPEQHWRPRQAEFALQRIGLNPNSATLTGYVDEPISIPYRITAADGTTATNVRLEYSAEAQEGGELLTGITVDLSASVSLDGSGSVDIPVVITPTENAQAAGSLVLQLKSDEGQNLVLAESKVNFRFAARPGEPPLPNAYPNLKLSNNLIETGVDRGAYVDETIALENIGLAPLEQVSLALVSENGSPLTNSWAYLLSDQQRVDIPVGEKLSASVRFAPPATLSEGIYQFRLRISSANFPTTEALYVVSVTESGVGGVLFRASDIYTATLDENGQVIQGLAGASIRLQNERVQTIDQTLTTDANGEVLFSDLSSGWYKYRVSANNHQEVIGRLQIKPNNVVNRDVFLDYNLVTVEWSVTEITIEDRYEITLSATFETDVPAPVIVMEPSSITLPDMQPGDVFNGELTLTNYGLIRADNVELPFNTADAYFRYEALIDIPDTLEAKQRLTIPYRITALASLDPSVSDGGTGGACYRYIHCKTEYHDYECANGTISQGSTKTCWSKVKGDCGNPSPGGGGTTGGRSWFGGGGGGGFGGGGGGGGGGGSPTWRPYGEPIEEAPYCPPTCPDGQCCQEPGDKDAPGQPPACMPPPSSEPPPPGTGGEPTMCEPAE